MIKSKHEDEINTTAQEQKNSVSNTRIFQTSINVNEHRLRAIIDSGATENFMSQILTERKKFTLREKHDAYDIIVIDKSSLLAKDERVNKETISLTVAIRRHHEKLIFDIVEMIIHDIVLKVS